MKRYLPFLIILAVAIGATAGGVAIYKAKKTELAKVAPAATPKGAAVDAGAKPPHRTGPEKGAAVTLEEFGDFQCPPCRNLATILEKLEHDYPTQLNVVFRQFPLISHQHAQKAAALAEAAAAQGKFWQMHKLLYENQSTWSAAGDPAPMFESYAQQIGLDVERYKTDITAPNTHARIAADQARAKSLGVNSTPSLFINGELVPFTSVNDQGLRRAIDDAIRGKKPIFDRPKEASPAPTK